MSNSIQPQNSHMQPCRGSYWVDPSIVIGDGSCDVHTCWVSGGEDRRDKQGEEAAKTFFLLSRFTWAVASTTTVRGSLLLASLCLLQEQRGPSVSARQPAPSCFRKAIMRWETRAARRASCCLLLLCSGVQRQGELGEASLRCKCRKL